jgi:hypothetical protein
VAAAEFFAGVRPVQRAEWESFIADLTYWMGLS